MAIILTARAVPCWVLLALGPGAYWHTTGSKPILLVLGLPYGTFAVPVIQAYRLLWEC